MAYQQINCNVDNCQHNDQACHCTLTDITVGNTAATPHAKRDTECDSFNELI